MKESAKGRFFEKKCRLVHTKPLKFLVLNKSTLINKTFTTLLNLKVYKKPFTLSQKPFLIRNHLLKVQSL